MPGMLGYWWFTAVALSALLLLGWSLRPQRRRSPASVFVQARREFRLRREWLEVRFIVLAARRSPSGIVRWSECSFEDDVSFVRSRASGELSALVEIAVPVEDSCCGDGQTVNRRVGTAIFRFQRKRWSTDGWAILNLNPAEAIRFYREDFEIVEQEPASQS